MLVTRRPGVKTTSIKQRPGDHRIATDWENSG
jgi:hypothetical protein